MTSQGSLAIRSLLARPPFITAAMPTVASPAKTQKLCSAARQHCNRFARVRLPPGGGVVSAWADALAGNPSPIFCTALVVPCAALPPGLCMLAINPMMSTPPDCACLSKASNCAKSAR
eukprot:6466398-Amphidinium_carterae.1